jgi:hypothetical protein
MLLDLDISVSEGSNCFQELRSLYDCGSNLSYLSQQVSINDEQVVQDMPLKTLRPVIAAWTEEELKE